RSALAARPVAPVARGRRRTRSGGAAAHRVCTPAGGTGCCHAARSAVTLRGYQAARWPPGGTHRCGRTSRPASMADAPESGDVELAGPVSPPSGRTGLRSRRSLTHRVVGTTGTGPGLGLSPGPGRSSTLGPGRRLECTHRLRPVHRTRSNPCPRLRPEIGSRLDPGTRPGHGLGELSVELGPGARAGLGFSTEPGLRI